jgi:TRAP-type C4-dicarboxylate transport system permease small subunit
MGKVFRVARHAAEGFGVALFAIVFLAINTQVFMRYIVGRPVRWSEELPTLAFSLAALWAGSVMLRASDHIVFDSVFVLLPEKTGRILYGICAIILAAVLFAVVPGVLDFALYMKVLSTPILRIRYDIIFLFFTFFILASGIVHLAWGIRAFRKPLDDVDPSLV